MKKFSISLLFILLLANLLLLNNSFAVTTSNSEESLEVTEVNLLTNEEKTFEVLTNSNLTELLPYVPTNSIQPFSVIGGDDRQIIRDTNSHPYRCIGRIFTTYSDGTQGGGTAFLVSKNVILTAGHCVVNEKHGKATDIVFYPGAMGAYNNPYGNAKAIKCTVSNSWSSNFNKNYDWAIVVLNSNIGDKCGWMGVRAYSDYNACKNMYVTISGYPTYDSSHPDISVEWQYKASGTITGASEYLLTYKIDATGGQSGAPIFPSDNYAIGINTREYNYLSKNEGNRITTSMLSTLQNVISNNS